LLIVGGDQLLAFLEWLGRGELADRPDAGRVTEQLGLLARTILEGAGDIRGRRVLDLGAGTGVLTAAAAARGALPTAVDLDGHALTRGRDAAPGLGIRAGHVRGDARALPFGDGVFQVSVHRSVLGYMDRRPAAVAEERRVLAPGGRVAASESLGLEAELVAEDPGLVRVWEGLQEVLGEAAAYAVTLGEVRGLYRDAGFHTIRTRRLELDTPLDSPAAVARAFALDPPAGVSARHGWRAAGVPRDLVDQWLARLSLAAERGRPARLRTPEGLLTARR
jgi:SAM-dependent methyltransferase